MPTTSSTGGRNGKTARYASDALWVYKKYMIALGSDAELFDTEFDVEEEAREHIGDPCILVIGQEPDNRNKEVMRNVIEDVRAAGF